MFTLTCITQINLEIVERISEPFGLYNIWSCFKKKIKCDDGNDIIYLDNTRMT